MAVTDQQVAALCRLLSARTVDDVDQAQQQFASLAQAGRGERVSGTSLPGLLVTSANFSWSAENGNLELGVLINPNLAEAVEHEMRHVEDFVFERVLAPG